MMMRMQQLSTPCEIGAVQPRRRPLLPLLMAVTLWLCATVHRGSCAYDYAVQPRTVNFTAIPLSQTVVSGESFSLHCNFTVTKLGSLYPVPHLEWWKDGQRLLDPEEPNKENIRAGYVASTLEVDRALSESGGYYECIAVDGKRRKDTLGRAKQIISSPRAHIQVISLDDFETGSSASDPSLEPYGLETVTLRHGEPHVIPCDLGRVGISDHILWYQNGTLSNRNTILSNGSLLLPAASSEDSGQYHCSLRIGNESVDSQMQHLIQVTEDPYQGGPHLYTDTPTTVPLLPGASLNIHFYILRAPPTATPNDTPLSVEVKVLRNGRWSFAGSPDIVNSPLKRVYVFETGLYNCTLIKNGRVVSAMSVDVVSGYTSTARDITDVFVTEDFVNRYTLDCSVPGGSPYQSVYWYRNGTLIPEVSEDRFELEGRAQDLDSFVYQSFIVTSVGVIHQCTWRLFSQYFTNPPTNVRCSVKFRNFEAGDYVPQVTVRWDPPDFAVPGRTLRYRVYAGEGGGLTETKRSEGLSAEIYLENIDDLETSEEVYAFFVKNEVNVKGGVYDSASERCDFNTIQRGLNPPLPFTPTCVHDSTTFLWKNPLAVAVSRLDIQATCIYKHNLYQFDLCYSSDFFTVLFNDECKKAERNQEDFVLILNANNTVQAGHEERAIPQGSACRATGSYLFDHSSVTSGTDIPPKSCVNEQTLRDTANVYLELVCGEDSVEMEWITTFPVYRRAENMTLQMSCLNGTDNQLHKVFLAEDAELVGNSSVEVNNALLCSFYGEFTDTRSGERVEIPSVQCVKGQAWSANSVPPSITPPLTTAAPSTSTTTDDPDDPDDPSTSDSPTTPSIQPTNMSITSNTTIVLKISIPSSVVLAVLIILALAFIIFLKCRTSSRYARRVELSMDWDLDKNYQPFNPEVIDKTMSMETVYNNGEEWDANNDGGSPCHEQVFKLDTRTPLSSEEVTESGETPALSPIVVVETNASTNAAEDSGCGLQLSGDGNRGKVHLLNRFLTGIHDDNKTSETDAGSDPPQTKLDVITVDDRDSPQAPLLDKFTFPSSIAQMVADRLHDSSSTTVPSSGYGTADCYKFSTDTPEFTPEYLAQKLRDVEESESIHDNPDDLSNPVKDAPPTVETSSKLDLTLRSVTNTEFDQQTQQLPSLLLTSPQLSHSGSVDLGPSVPDTQLVAAGSNLSTSASTGNLSSSYYQDNEGYLHVSSATNSGQTHHPHHHQSYDTLTKSL